MFAYWVSELSDSFALLSGLGHRKYRYFRLRAAQEPLGRGHTHTFGGRPRSLLAEARGAQETSKSHLAEARGAQERPKSNFCEARGAQELLELIPETP